MPQAWIIQTDGTAAPNPGAIAIGVVVIAPDGTRHTESRVLDTRGCNNEAEASAVVAGLALAQRLGARSVRVVVDSAVVVDELSDRRRSVAPRLVVVADAMRALWATFETATITLVPRRHNAEADALARGALGLPPKVRRPSRWRHSR